MNTLDIEKGYGFVFSRDFTLLEHQYRILFFAFIGSIIGILIILTALTENLFHTIIITSIIPVSCVLPLLFKFITKTPLEMGDIIGMVIISGISVNNAIYIVESLKSNIFFKIREKIQSILGTSLTTIVSAVPLVIINNGGFTTTLAVNVLLGTSGSLLAALLLFPAVYYRFNQPTPPQALNLTHRIF